MPTLRRERLYLFAPGAVNRTRKRSAIGAAFGSPCFFGDRIGDEQHSFSTFIHARDLVAFLDCRLHDAIWPSHNCTVSLPAQGLIFRSEVVIPHHVDIESYQDNEVTPPQSANILSELPTASGV